LLGIEHAGLQLKGGEALRIEPSEPIEPDLRALRLAVPDRSANEKRQVLRLVRLGCQEVQHSVARFGPFAVGLIQLGEEELISRDRLRLDQWLEHTNRRAPRAGTNVQRDHLCFGAQLLTGLALCRSKRLDSLRQSEQRSGLLQVLGTSA